MVGSSLGFKLGFPVGDSDGNNDGTIEGICDGIIELLGALLIVGAIGSTIIKKKEMSKSSVHSPVNNQNEGANITEDKIKDATTYQG